MDEKIDEHERAKQLKLLRKYLYEVTYKSTAHGKAEADNRKKNKYTAFSQALLSAVVGVLGVAAWNNVDECGSSTNIALIASGIALSFTASAVGIVRSVWRFSTKEANHHASAGNFSDVASDIELFLAGNLSDLELIKHFVDTTHERLDIYNDCAAGIGSNYTEAAKTATPYPKNGNGSTPRSAIIRQRRLKKQTDCEMTAIDISQQ